MSGTSHLTKDELKILIEKHKGEYIVGWYMREYSKLWSKEPHHISANELMNLKIKSKVYLNLFGYTNTEIYRENIFDIINKLNLNINVLYGMGYSQEAIALSIVTEVLDYYNANYEDICNELGLDPNEYMDSKIYIHEWCKKNYWKPLIRISA